MTNQEKRSDEKFCHSCGNAINMYSEFCVNCGAHQSRIYTQMPYHSTRLILPAFLLCFCFGTLGFHRFYVGKVGTGILQIFTLGGLFIWTFIDLIMIVVGQFRDDENKKLVRWT